MESFLCKKCKQLLTPMTKLNFFEHIKSCKGIDADAPLGVTFHKWPPSPNRQEKPHQTIVIGPSFQERPQTRG